MVKILAAFFIAINMLNTSCNTYKPVKYPDLSVNRTHFSESDLANVETIVKLSEKANSKDEAIKYFDEWLRKETNFNDKDNQIESIEKYKDYYEIRLKTSIIINGRLHGVIGFRDYVLTEDGILLGYYYSK